MNKFLHLDKSNFFYSVLLIVLVCMVILPLLSCNTGNVCPTMNGTKYYFAQKKYKPKKEKKIDIRKENERTTTK